MKLTTDTLAVALDEATTMEEFGLASVQAPASYVSSLEPHLCTMIHRYKDNNNHNLQ